MELYQHDRDFSIKINGQDLMNSRQHESELELARLGCAHLAGSKAPSILIGGLGLGYTLRQVLDMLSPHAKVVVGELLSAVVEWNREFLWELNGQSMGDERVELKAGDIVDLISRSKRRFDAILLDIDNGPSAMTNSENRRLYSYEGIMACRHALCEQGCLAVWSAEPSKKFEQLLMSCRFHVRRFRIPAYKGSKSQSRFVTGVAGNTERDISRGYLGTASVFNRSCFHASSSLHACPNVPGTDGYRYLNPQ
jgi:spermidine synthase